MNDNLEKIKISWDDVNSADNEDTTQAAEPPPQAPVNTVKNGWSQLTAVKVGVALVIAVALLGFLIFWRVDVARRNNPMTTITVIDSIPTESDLIESRQFFTPKGYGLLQWMISESQASDGAPMQLSYGPPDVSGETCQVWGTSGDTRMAIQLVKADRWLFDDIYVATIEGQDVNLMATYIRDHPMKTWFKMSWPELLDSFIQGFLIGLSGGA